MSAPAATFAEFLRSEALFAQADSPAIKAAWGDDAPQSERVTALAFGAAAETEAARQRTFMGQAMALEVHSVKGRFAPLLGKTVTLTGTALGYQAGLDVLVLGAQDDAATGMSRVSVLRRL